MKQIITPMVLLFSLSANAEFFKSLDANGKTTYQNTPCPDDKGYFFDLDKNTKISVEEYKKKKEQEQERLKQEFEAAKKTEEQKSKSYPNYYTGPTSGSTSGATSKSSSTYSGGRTIHTGPRGGKYYYNSSGNKTYVRRK